MSNLNSITYGRLINTFYQEINKPEDHTNRYWYHREDEIHYSGSGDEKSPDLWLGGGFSGELKNSVDKEGYVLVTLDDGFGGEFQAFLALENEIDPEEYE